MAWLFGAGLAGKAGAGALLGPIGICVCGAAVLGHAIYLANRRNGGGPQRKVYIERQRDGEKDSSEAETYFHLGAVDTYENIKLHERPFTRDGDKYYVEADHIPPLQSLRRAREQPEFPSLRYTNPNLYWLVRSMETDPRGEQRLTVQVARHHHRDALSSGNSSESTQLRELLASRIARGEAMKMLKQAFIIAHPYASQQIRDDAGIGNRPPQRRMLLSRDRTMRIYRTAFLELILKYFEIEQIINCQERDELIEFVENDGYLDRGSWEYQEIVDIVRRYSRR